MMQRHAAACWLCLVVVSTLLPPVSSLGLFFRTSWAHEVSAQQAKSAPAQRLPLTPPSSV